MKNQVSKSNHEKKPGGVAQGRFNWSLSVVFFVMFVLTVLMAILLKGFVTGSLGNGAFSAGSETKAGR